MQENAERKVFWLSFCDPDLPKGEQFLGACLIEVTAADAHEATIRPFPFAPAGSDWLAAALRKANSLGCNPGGEVEALEVDISNPHLARHPFGVLMDRATIERLDKAPK
jgi:hypothetical protein